MKLASIILCKMDRDELHVNEFAIELKQRIDSYRQESASGNILPQGAALYEEFENVFELRSLLA